MARIANLEFGYQLFYSKDLSVQVLRDILNALPSDTKIVGMDSDYNKNITFIRVESSSFIDTQAAGVIPSIDVLLNRSSNGVVSFNILDMSRALQSYAQQSQNSCTCTSFIICVNCINSAMQNRNVPMATNIPPSSVPIPYTSTSKRTGYSLAGTSTGGFTGGCQHVWKTYDSGFSKYEYCSSCNVKKDAEKIY